MTEFQDIYTTYARRVYRFLLALTGNTSEAEELTQQTFYRAFLHIGRFEGRSSLYTWLCQIGKNEWFRECRRRRRFAGNDVDARTEPTGSDGSGRGVSVDPTDVSAANGSVEDHIVRKEDGRRAAQALCGLPQPYRDVVILRIYGELPFAEIAALFEKSVSWSKVTFFRGKEKLRNMMEEPND
ncbi:MAG: RNA polymerase sigma factor [Clostridiaceae bacterium]|nr:RNA polymerase sigma factor [Clostridiaceae bacterium]